MILMQKGYFQFAPRAGASTKLGAPGVAAASAGRAAGRPTPAAAGRSESEILRSYAARWLAGIEGAIRPRTFESYSAQLRLHVLPSLGERELGDIDVDDVL